MRLYVASKFENRNTVAQLMRVLITDGHRIDVDWTGEEAGTDEQQALNAALDLVGVQMADALVVLVPEQGGCGMFFEMGVATNMGKPIYCIGADGQPATNRMIFQNLPGIIKPRSITELRGMLK